MNKPLFSETLNELDMLLIKDAATSVVEKAQTVSSAGEMRAALMADFPRLGGFLQLLEREVLPGLTKDPIRQEGLVNGARVALMALAQYASIEYMRAEFPDAPLLPS